MLASALLFICPIMAMANEGPQDRSNMGGQMKSRAEASMRRIVDRVTKEAKARMERKPSGEKKGMSKGEKEDLLHPYTAKKSSGGMSALEKVVVALLALGLLGSGGLVFKASRASKSDV